MGLRPHCYLGSVMGKKKTTISTTISPVFQPKKIPDTVLSATLTAIFKKQDIGESILEELIGCIGIKGHSYFNYGKKAHIPGLPKSKMMSPVTGEDEVAAVLSSIEGAPVIIKYYNIGPSNFLHSGWQSLIASYGYNPNTNEITALSAPGKTVYLKDMVPVIVEDEISEYDSDLLIQLGTPPSGRYFPGCAVGMVPGDTDPKAVFSTIILDDAITEEALLVTYCWFNEPLTPEYEVDGPISYGSMYIALPEYDVDKLYSQTCYTVGGVIKYWAYEVGSGLYPTIDNVDISEGAIGEFFPTVYFRHRKTSLMVDKSTPAYKTSKKLMNKLGMSFEDMGTQINENPDIADVVTAMLVMAVPAESTDPACARYLFDFFERAFNLAEVKYNNAAEEALDTIAERPSNYSVGNIRIADGVSAVSIGIPKIRRRVRQGKACKKGEHTTVITTEMNPYTVNKGGSPFSIFRPVTVHNYKYQISANTYVEVSVFGMGITWEIAGGYVKQGDGTSGYLLIPIDKTISENYSIAKRERLYAFSLNMVFHSVVITKIKWYQTGIFQIFMIIVAVVITVVSLGGAAPLLAAAIATGSVLAVAIAVATIVLDLLIQYAIGQLIKLFVKAIGLKNAFVVAVILAVVSKGKTLTFGSFQGAPFAMSFLSLSSNIIIGMNETIIDMTKDLQKEAIVLDAEQKKLTKELEVAQALLENDLRISPMIFFGESPQDFYNRTVHSGNTAQQCIDSIKHYAKTALQLPTPVTLAGETEEEEA